MNNKKVIFMGTPDFACPILEMLIQRTNVVLVVTQPDKEVGRKKVLTPSPVKKVALDHGVAVFQPQSIKKDFAKLKEYDVDLIVTCAYGQILSKEILDIPKYGCINVHASILPKYRGSAPIQWALFNGDKETGITIMYMDEGMDSGDIIEIQKIAIADHDNVGSLHDKLSVLGKNTLESVLPKIFTNDITRMKQPDEYTLAPMIKRSDERLDFTTNGQNIINKIRGLNPWPLANINLNHQEIKVIDAYFQKSNVTSCGQIVKIDKKNLAISCQDGLIYLTKIKPSGKNVMDITSFLNGIDKEKYQNMVVANENKSK